MDQINREQLGKSSKSGKSKADWNPLTKISKAWDGEWAKIEGDASSVFSDLLIFVVVIAAIAFVYFGFTWYMSSRVLGQVGGVVTNEQFGRNVESVGRAGAQLAPLAAAA